MKPNFETCQECPNWDDINGCWNNIKKLENCDYINEEGNFEYEP